MIVTKGHNAKERPLKVAYSLGFTIVELLIVVVIIGILAAIVVVAYNGITTEAKNSKTLAAADGWIKGLRLYEAQNGTVPAYSSCLGTMTTYPDNGQCWESASWDMDSNFLNAMAPFMGTQPEPDVSSTSSTNPERRGLLYAGTRTPPELYVFLLGTGSINDCPTTSLGAAAHYGNNDLGGHCIYDIE